MTRHHPPLDHPPGNNHGARRAANGGGARPKRRRSIRHIDRRTLTDTAALLAAWRDECARGSIDAGELDRFRWASAAVHALRVERERGGSAAALFASMINRRHFVWISAGDEDQAQRRLQAHDRAHAAPPPPSDAAQTTPAPADLSADAKHARAMIAAARKAGREPLEVARAVGWTRSRFDAAAAELDDARLAGVQQRPKQEASA